ncbi:MAG: T9SS type A sorting domain-containing protein [Bacteroidetes bacterium]|nr:T9SS type A sorting domain-containing protein [Bacteroidota bacterium]
MIKKITISIGLIVFAIFLFNGINKTLVSSTAGAPAKNTGSPGDAQNCATSCHTGPATTVSGWITSNIPVSGYLPDSTYTITATATCAGKTIFGFQISPQDNIGNKKGTLLVTSATTTQTVSTTGITDNKYMTHRAAGTTGTTGSHTWSFNWKAPSIANATAVTFYGAFVAATASTDTVFLCTKTYSKATGIENYSKNDFDMDIFPNPTTDKITISLANSASEMINIFIYDINGKQVAQLEKSNSTSGKFHKTYSITNKLSKGTYFVNVLVGEKNSIKKIVVL